MKAGPAREPRARTDCDLDEALSAPPERGQDSGEDSEDQRPTGKNEVLAVRLVEQPLTILLRKLTGHTWRYKAMWGYAEFAFDASGNVTGTHKIPLGGVMEDLGRIESLGAESGKFVVSFTPSRPYAFYTGEVKMQLLDDNNLKLNWRYNSGTVDYTYTRTDAAAGATKGMNLFGARKTAEDPVRKKR